MYSITLSFSYIQPQAPSYFLLDETLEQGKMDVVGLQAIVSIPTWQLEKARPINFCGHWLDSRWGFRDGIVRSIWRDFYGDVPDVLLRRAKDWFKGQLRALEEALSESSLPDLEDRLKRRQAALEAAKRTYPLPPASTTQVLPELLRGDDDSG